MKELPGKRAGSSLFFHKNFIYHRDKRFCDLFRCALRRKTGCTGILMKINNAYILKTRHNHSGNSLALKRILMKKKMLTMCRDTVLQPKEIFDAVCRGNPEAALHLSYTSMKSVLNRERAKHRPPLPKSVGELNEVLQNYEPINLIYQGSVVATDGTMAFLFSTNILLEALSASKELYVDGLCSVVPKDPKLSQLYTVHIRYMDKGICAVFALCESRTTELYNAIWEKINEMAPGLQENVEFTMSDYERAALNALENSFPAADMRGCWFHFKQAVKRKWKSLDLGNEKSDLLSMTTSLPLVPEDNFEEAIGILKTVVKDDSKDSNENKFLSYIRNTWLPLASKVSVYMCRLRTNTIVESFNNIAARQLGGNHPNLWVFLNHLKTFIADQELHLARLMNGQSVGRARRRKDVERDAKIFQAQTDLASGRLPLEQFLRKFDSRNEDKFDAPRDEDDTQAEIEDGDNADGKEIGDPFINEDAISSDEDDTPSEIEDGDNANGKEIGDPFIDEDAILSDEDDTQAEIEDGDNANGKEIGELIIDEEETSWDGEEGELAVKATADNSKHKVPVKSLSVRETSQDKNIVTNFIRNKVVDHEETIPKKALRGKERLPIVVLHRLTVKHVENVENRKIESNAVAVGNKLSLKRKLPQREMNKRSIKMPARYRF